MISADEKTSIQARIRKHATTPPAPRRPMRVEHEYARGGALAYLAAWDVHRAKVFGRCEDTTGIEPFDRLVEQVMTCQPYASARRVFWVVDNGSSHRGQACIDRLEDRWPTLRLIHLPVHASWLNQVEIYFSVVQRKVVSPNDFRDLSEVESRLLDFQQHYEQIATPFEWKFTKNDLNALLERIAAHDNVQLKHQPPRDEHWVASSSLPAESRRPVCPGGLRFSPWAVRCLAFAVPVPLALLGAFPLAPRRGRTRGRARTARGVSVLGQEP